MSGSQPGESAQDLRKRRHASGIRVEQDKKVRIITFISAQVTNFFFDSFLLERGVHIRVTPSVSLQDKAGTWGCILNGNTEATDAQVCCLNRYNNYCLLSPY